MAGNGQRKKLGKERLQHIIDLCRSVEEIGVDPFVIDVDKIIAVVREYFPEWELPEELCLDAEAIQQLSSAIKLQSDWVKHRTTSLYTDPFLLKEKIRQLGKEDFVNLCLKAWNPIVELEQISPYSLIQAIKYWKTLLPLSDRWLKTTSAKNKSGVVTRQELVRRGMLSEEAFSEELEALWEELKKRVDEEGRIRYWDFIGANTYPETIYRAYMTSFLVTYRYATLEVYRLEEEIFIKPFNKPKSLLENTQLISIPVSISFEDWKQWRDGN